MNLSCKRALGLLIFILVLALTFAQAYPESQSLPVIEKVIILSGKRGSVPTDTSKIIEYHKKIRLYALLKCKGSYYLGYEDSLLPKKIKIKGKLHSLKHGSLKRWSKNEWGRLNIKWYKIMPRMVPSSPRGEYKWYSNVFSEEGGQEGKWRGWQIIEYEQLPLKEEGWDMEPNKQAGTARFRAEVVLREKIISSPGRPDPNHPSNISPRDYDKGIKDTVHRISRLSNHPHKLIRYIEALKGVPWLWGPDYRDAPQNTLSSHQSDFHNPVGIECSSLLISALRAMGNKNLKYTTTKNLAVGKYTHPITDMSLTLSKRTFFEDWTPRGISWSGEDRFYVYGAEKIQIRDKKFNLIEEIKNASYQFVDIALSQGEKIYSIVEKGVDSKIIVIQRGEDIRELFTPRIKKTVLMGEKKYLCPVKINPVGIEVANPGAAEGEEKIYLLDSDTIYVFNLQGKQLEAIPLQGALTRWSPLGSLSVKGELFYIPVNDKKILVFNLKGKIVNTIKPQCQKNFLDADIRKDKIALLQPFPMRVQLYRLNGSFFMGFTDRFLNEQGEEVRIKVGSSPQHLQIGDLMITTSPSYHLLLFYQDNGNKLLDSKDKVICAGHKGIEIRKVSYFEGRKFLLKRLNPGIKVQ